VAGPETHPARSQETQRRHTTLSILYLEEDPRQVTELIQALDQAEGKSDWDVAHAKTPDDARAIAKKQPIDVALLSATMSEMDPVAIAEELTQIHRKITIFILAPDAETGGGLAYASGRFQWLAKPCPPETLIPAIERMAMLVSWLTNNTTIDLVAGLHSLPTIPSNYQGVIRAIHSPNSSIQDIADAVGKDMGITSRVLQVANSAYYGYSKKITSPMEASMLLGIDTLKSLVRYTHVLNNFPQTPATNAIFDAVWRHSAGVAAVARKIVLLQTNDEALGDEAFTAALLHDIGKVVLASLKPDDYKLVIRQAAETKTPIHMVERIKLQTTHAETGAYLLSLWGIPFSILEAVAWHHYPRESKDKKFSALTAVHVANVAEHQRQQTDGQRTIPTLDEIYLTEVGVWKEAQEWVKLRPDRAASDLPLKPYVVKPAIAVARSARRIPTWVWVIISMLAGMAAMLVAISIFSK
jgi:HD-like signal output (HDOD) protein/CheY-like chemotaxis protein